MQYCQRGLGERTQTVNARKRAGKAIGSETNTLAQKDQICYSGDALKQTSTFSSATFNSKNTKSNKSSSGGLLCKTTALVQSGTVAKVRSLELGKPEPVMTPFLTTSITEPFSHLSTSVSVPAKAGIITPISVDETSCCVSDRRWVQHAVDD